MNDISPREYGQLENEVKHLSDQMVLMQKDLRCIRDFLEQGRGGWRTLVWIGGAAASAGGILSWVISHWPTK